MLLDSESKHGGGSCRGITGASSQLRREVERGEGLPERGCLRSLRVHAHCAGLPGQALRQGQEAAEELRARTARGGAPPRARRAAGRTDSATAAASPVGGACRCRHVLPRRARLRWRRRVLQRRLRRRGPAVDEEVLRGPSAPVAAAPPPLRPLPPAGARSRGKLPSARCPRAAGACPCPCGGGGSSCGRRSVQRSAAGRPWVQRRGAAGGRSPPS